MDQIGELIQQRVVAADDDEGVLELLLRIQQADTDLFTGLEALGPLGDLNDAVGLHEGGDHTAAAGQRRGGEPVADITHPDADVFLILETGDHRPCQNGTGPAAAFTLPAEPQFDQRPQQLLNDDDAGDRVAGDTENRLRPAAAEDRGLAGLDGDAASARGSRGSRACRA